MRCMVEELNCSFSFFRPCLLFSPLRLERTHSAVIVDLLLRHTHAHFNSDSFQGTNLLFELPSVVFCIRSLSSSSFRRRLNQQKTNHLTIRERTKTPQPQHFSSMSPQSLNYTDAAILAPMVSINVLLSERFISL